MVVVKYSLHISDAKDIRFALNLSKKLLLGRNGGMGVRLHGLVELLFSWGIVLLSRLHRRLGRMVNLVMLIKAS